MSRDEPRALIPRRQRGLDRMRFGSGKISATHQAFAHDGVEAAGLLFLFVGRIIRRIDRLDRVAILRQLFFQEN
jgi:hypothetical protein